MTNGRAASSPTWRRAVAFASLVGLAWAQPVLAQPPPVASAAVLRGVVHDAEGPVAGASVRARRRITDPHLTGYSPYQGRSAIDGSFAIEGVDPGVWHDLEVEAPWHRKGAGGGTSESGPIDVTLIATGAIEGDVVADAIGLVASCRPVDDPGYYSRRSAPVRNARFAFDDLLPDTYECNVRGRRLASDMLSVEVKAGVATRVTVTPVARPAISVRTIDATTQRPVAGALVEWGFSFGRSGSKGRLELEIPSDEPLPSGGTPRQSPIYVESDGFEQAFITVPDPPPATLTVSLFPSPRVRGRIVDADLQPASGAEVLLDTEPWIRADANGSFEVARPAAREDTEHHLLAARYVHDGITERATEYFDELPSCELLVTLTRVERAQVSVTVRDPSGPIGGARVHVESPTATSRGLTDADGRFVSPMLDEGSYNVRIESPGKEELRYQEVVLRPGDRVAIDVLMDDGWTLDGHVVKAGRPVAGAIVGWYAEGASGSAPRTDATGAFHVGPIPRDRGEALVTASVGNARAAVSARADSASIVLELGWVTLRGRVVEGAQPIAGARISVDSMSRDDSPVVTNSAGEFSLEQVPASRACDLVVRMEGRPSHAIAIRTIAEGMQVLGDIRVGRRVVRGRATVAQGGDVWTILVRTLLSNGGLLDTLSIQVEPGGGFEVELPLGETRYVALSDGIAPITGVLREDESPRWKFIRGAVLEIEARRPGGASAHGEAMLVSHERLAPLVGEAALTAQVDEHGIARFASLPAGHAIVELRDRGLLARIEVDLVAEQTARVIANLR
jgi:hypothetical protein